MNSLFGVDEEAPKVRATNTHALRSDVVREMTQRKEREKIKQEMEMRRMDGEEEEDQEEGEQVCENIREYETGWWARTKRRFARQNQSGSCARSCKIISLTICILATILLILAAVFAANNTWLFAL
mmetsp:Transcript_21958/g.61719  ORF Transcript_21958/g.61719 Transcript_21958/m.61719 type:complete len:126 (-) Transcript_21958:914-1291(-)